jgi:hypothetical protein
MLLGLVAAQVTELDPRFREAARIAVDTWFGMHHERTKGEVSDVTISIRRHIMHLLDNPDLEPQPFKMEPTKRTWKRRLFEWLERG